MSLLAATLLVLDVNVGWSRGVSNAYTGLKMELVNVTDIRQRNTIEDRESPRHRYGDKASSNLQLHRVTPLSNNNDGGAINKHVNGSGRLPVENFDRKRDKPKPIDLTHHLPWAALWEKKTCDIPSNSFDGNFDFT